MIKVALLPSISQGCNFYRIFQPFAILQKAGEVHCTWRVNQQTGQFGLSIQDVIDADVVVIQKLGGHTTGKEQDDATLKMCQEYGRKIVYECDDDLSCVTPENPCYLEELRYAPGHLLRMRGMMRACRLVTCTTPYLAEVLRKSNPDVRVVPNGIDFELWKGEPHDNEENVRIGYLASRNHVEDARLLIKPFRYIARHHQNVTFVMAGAFYPELKAALGDRIEFHEGVSIDQYPAWARSLRLDMGVAPLVDSHFARSKSPLKLLEYAALGIPGIASYCGPYRDVECFNGPRPVRSAHDWIVALEAFVNRPNDREHCVQMQRAAVQERFTAQHSADAWLSVIKEVIG